MGFDMNRTLVEAALGRALRGMEESPERSIRNLIDLGLHFSNGRFQQHFLGTAQEMLRNQDSAYYSLLKDALAHVDQKSLLSLGINLGYNSCTKGAAHIRALEAERGYNIPWMLSLGGDAAKGEPWESLMDQGAALGIFTYLFFPTGAPAPLLPLLRNHMDCAALLFLRSCYVTEALLRDLRKIKNSMAVVWADEDMGEACGMLRQAGLPFGVCLRYTGADRDMILSGGWLERLLPAHPLFAFLLPDADCPLDVQEQIYAYIQTLRESQQYPVVPVDISRDGLKIDEIISHEGCLVGFDRDGVLHTHLGVYRDETFNFFQNRLEDILQRLQALRQAEE